MGDFIVLDGDPWMAGPAFGPAIAPGLQEKWKADGQAKVKIGGKLVCVVGDEVSVKWDSKNYIAGAFLGGNGKQMMPQLGPDQKAIKVTASGKPVVLKGAVGIVEFQPEQPGKTPPPANVPDPVPMDPGTWKTMTCADVKTKAT